MNSVQEFDHFLKLQGAFDQFYFNRNERLKRLKVNPNNAKPLSALDPMLFVRCSFIWSKTPEGTDYWQIINTKWLNYVASNC